MPCVAASVLCLGALAEWPYGYYTFLRWVVTISAVLLAAHGYARVTKLENPVDRRWWSLAVIPGLAALAILFNPLAPITMERGNWGIFDLAAAVVFAVGFFVSFDLRRVPASTEGGSDTWEPAQRGNTRLLPQTLGKWMVGLAIGLVLVTVAGQSTPGGDPDCVGFEPGEC